MRYCRMVKDISAPLKVSQGVWAQADTLEACREELREVLEEWIILGLKVGHPLPSIDGITLTIQEVA